MRGDRGFFELCGLEGLGLVGGCASCRFAGRRLGCGRVAGERVAGERVAGERDLVALLGPVRGPFLGTRDCRALLDELLDELLDDFDLPFLVAANLRKSSIRVASTGPSTSIIANWSPMSSVASAVLKMA